MGNQIHSFLISDKYAARVSNPYMYDTVRYLLNSTFYMFFCLWSLWSNLYVYVVSGRNIMYAAATLKVSEGHKKA